MVQMAMEHHRQEVSGNPIHSWIVDAAYNHHCHLNSCFDKCTKVMESSASSDGKGKKHKIMECRYRFPQHHKATTTIDNVSEIAVAWYSWHGLKEDRFINDVLVRRCIYNAFQNVCCPAISLLEAHLQYKCKYRYARSHRAVCIQI